MSSTDYRDAAGLLIKYADLDLADGSTLPRSAPSASDGAPVYPAGARAATAQGQADALTALTGIGSAIGTQLPAALGPTDAARSLSVTLATNEPLAKAVGAPADAVAGSDTGSASLIALTKRGLGYLATLAGAVKSGAFQIAAYANPSRLKASGVLSAANAALTLAVDGMATVGVQITGVFVGTVQWRGSIDDGATFFALNATPFGAGLSGPSVPSASAPGQWEIAASPLTHVQAVMSAYTSGTAGVLLVATNGAKIARVKAPASDPLPVMTPGGAPQDFSTAKPSTVGLALLASLPAGPRFGWSVQNQSTANIVVTLDDGAGNALTSYIAGPADTMPGQGGALNSSQVGNTQGRITVYGAASASAAIRQW